MKKLVCWMMTLALLLSCAGGLAETAAGNEMTSFLQITGSAPVPVYEKITDTEKADELQPGQLCGLLDDLTTEEGVRWYQIVYMNKSNKSAVGYVRPEYAHQLTLAEFNALSADPAKANEAMDLLSAVDASLKGESGTGSSGSATPAGTESAAGEAEGGKSAQAGTDLFKEFYASAMKALDKVFNMDVTGAISEVTNQARNVAGKAVDAGLDILGFSLSGVKGLVTILSSEAANRIAGAAPALGKKLGEVLDAAGAGIGWIGGKAKEGIGVIAGKAASGIGTIGAAAKGGIAGIAGQAENGIGTLADKATEEIGEIAGQVQGAAFLIGAVGNYGIREIATQAEDGFGKVTGQVTNTISTLGNTAKDSIETAAPGMTDDLEKLLKEMKDQISSLRDAAEGPLGTWVDDINNLFEKDGESTPENPISETMTDKLAKLKDNLAESTSGVVAVVQTASEKIEKDGLIEFAAQLLHNLSLNDADQWADFWKPATAGDGN